MPADLRDIEDRIRKIEVDRLPDLQREVANLSRILEHELLHICKRQDEQAKALGEHHDTLWGTDLREGLIHWRRSMEKRIKSLTAVLAAVGTMLLALLKDFVTRWMGH